MNDSMVISCNTCYMYISTPAYVHACCTCIPKIHHLIGTQMHVHRYTHTYTTTDHFDLIKQLHSMLQHWPDNTTHEHSVSLPTQKLLLSHCYLLSFPELFVSPCHIVSSRFQLLQTVYSGTADRGVDASHSHRRLEASCCLREKRIKVPNLPLVHD